MEPSLGARFFETIKPFDSYLKLFGISMRPASNPRWRLWLTNLWALFWLVLIFQADVCIFVWRALRALPHLFYSNEEEDGGDHGHSRMEDLNDFIFGAYPLSFDALIYLALVFSVRKTVNSTLNTLESVDALLGRPSLNILRRYSNIGIAWMASIVIIFVHFSFCVFTEICKSDDGTFSGSRLTQDLITIINEMCTSCSVFTFFIFGRLIIIYYSSIVAKLIYCPRSMKHSGSQFNYIVDLLRVLKRLQKASTLLHERFGFILLATCGLTIVSVVNSVYFIVRSVSGGDYVSPCWDLSFLTESVLRLLIVCHTSDRIRKSAMKCFPVVGKLRDELRERLNPKERIKLTLYAIEGYQEFKKSPELLGALLLSSRLILQITETALAFVVFVTQFENAEKSFRQREPIIVCKRIQ